MADEPGDLLDRDAAVEQERDERVPQLPRSPRGGINPGRPATARPRIIETPPKGAYTLTGMDAQVHTIAMEHQIPAGAFGPEPVTLDVRAYLVSHSSGLILVDTGMDPSGHALDAALSQLGAAWPDVSQVLITHAHPDHIGALDHVRKAAPAATVMASPLDGLPGLHPLADRDTIGPLKVIASPGHTAGHLCFLDEEHGALIVGDCLGTMAGRLRRWAPAVHRRPPCRRANSAQPAHAPRPPHAVRARPRARQSLGRTRRTARGLTYRRGVDLPA